MSCMFVCVLSIIIRGGSFLLLQTYRYHLSIHCCFLLIPLLYHGRTAASNRRPASMQVWTIMACCLLDNRLFTIWGLTLDHRKLDLFILLAISIPGSTQLPSIRISLDSSSPKTNFSSFFPLFFSSNSCIVSLIA